MPAPLDPRNTASVRPIAIALAHLASTVDDLCAARAATSDADAARGMITTLRAMASVVEQHSSGIGGSDALSARMDPLIDALRGTLAALQARNDDDKVRGVAEAMDDLQRRLRNAA